MVVQPKGACRTRGSRVVAPLLLLIALVALVLRLHGLNWDAGHYAHPDELFINSVAVDRLHWAPIGQLLRPESSPMNPRRLGSDGQHLDYAYGALLVYLLKGVSNAVARFFGQRFATYESVYLVGRTIAALADTLTVVVLYFVGRRLFDHRVGLLTAAFAALTVLQVQYSHFYTAEPLMTLFLALALWLVVRTLQQDASWNAGLAGLSLGLAIATKPSAAAFAAAALGILTAGAWLRGRQLRLVWKWPVLALVGMFVGWALFEPYALLDPHTYIANILHESQIQRGVLDYPYTRQYVGTVPVWYQVSQYVRFSVGLPLGFAVLAGLALALRAAWRRHPVYLVLLAWIAPYVLSIFVLETKWLRYLLPVSPVLVLLASAALWSWHDRLRAAGGYRRHVPALAITAIVAGTGLWALAFEHIYAQPHPWVAASEWIYGHVPTGSRVATEHWDTSLPLELPDHPSGVYQHVTMPMYDDLPPKEKLQQIEGLLNESDYIVIATNRLYGSIPRLPWRYAVATRYYELLFSNRLGYTRVASFSRSPTLGGSPISERGADESFTVYDHPTVYVFKKERRLLPWEYNALFSDALRAPWSPERRGSVDKSLMLRPYREPSQIGLPYFDGVWHSSWAALIIWLLVVEALALAGWLWLAPLLPESGLAWAVAKPVGLALVGWAAWLAASIGWLPSAAASVWMVFLAVLGLGIVLRLRRPVTINWREVLGFEALFILLFAGGTLLRSSNPDLWQPYYGGEKPMELAFISAILRSSQLPPYDPWFSGGYINYYYFGQWLVTVVMRLAGVGPDFGFNVAVATVFAYTGSLAAAIGYTIGKRFSVRTGVMTGALALLFLLLIGNLAAGEQFVHAALTHDLSGLWHDPFIFWTSTRLLEAQGFINEFPYFTFLYGDLHAHMLAMPIALSMLALGVSVALNRGRLGFGRVWLIAGVAGLLTGALATTNPWDVPAYLGLFWLALAYYTFSMRKPRLVPYGLGAALLSLVVAVVAYMPFYVNFKSFYSQIGRVTTPTPVSVVLTMLGLFLAIVLWYVVARSWRTRWGWAVLAVAAVLAAIGLATGRGTMGVLVGLLVGSLYTLGLNRDNPPALIWNTLASGGLLIWAGIEQLYLKDFLAGSAAYRMNTVFKFGLESWMLLALGSAGLVFLAWRITRPAVARFPAVAVVVILLLGSLVYPVYGTASRLRWRFPVPPARTLNGEAFLKTATLQNPHGKVENFAYDYQAIEWLRATVTKPDTIAEASIGPYRGFGSRVSMFTGMPDVLGWNVHESQQRYPDQVAQRDSDIHELYSTASVRQALALISKYGIQYIYVGPVERLHEIQYGTNASSAVPYSTGAGLRKFDSMVGNELQIAYKNPGVTIYRVVPSWQWKPASSQESAGG